MQRLVDRWKQYRYRFVPWIALNLKNRSVRSVEKGMIDKVASDAGILNTLLNLLSAFQTSFHDNSDVSARHSKNAESTASENLTVMKKVAGFQVERCASSIAGAGIGVKVTAGFVPAGAITSLYPGLIYEPYEPILVQSIGNPFIFRCIDSLLIDGNDRGISRFLFKSCHGRDRVGPYCLCDHTWLTDRPLNPLAVGQYVNNHNKENPANVAYQEFDVPSDFPLHLRHFLPNNFYSPALADGGQERRVRLVVLVATRDIHCGEELFSSYFTVVH